MSQRVCLLTWGMLSKACDLTLEVQRQFVRLKGFHEPQNQPGLFISPFSHANEHRRGAIRNWADFFFQGEPCDFRGEIRAQHIQGAKSQDGFLSRRESRRKMLQHQGQRSQLRAPPQGLPSRRNYLPETCSCNSPVMEILLLHLAFFWFLSH